MYNTDHRDGVQWPLVMQAYYAGNTSGLVMKNVSKYYIITTKCLKQSKGIAAKEQHPELLGLSKARRTRYTKG